MGQGSTQLSWVKEAPVRARAKDFFFTFFERKVWYGMVLLYYSCKYCQIAPLGLLKLTCAKTLVKVGRFAQLREPNSYCKSWQRGGSPASCNVVVGEAFTEGDDGEDEHGPVEAKDNKGGQVEVVPEVKITKFYEQLFCQNSFSKKTQI